MHKARGEQEACPSGGTPGPAAGLMPPADQKQIPVLEGVIKNLQQELSGLQQRLEAAERDSKKKDAQILELQSKLDEKDAELVAVEEQLHELMAKTANLFNTANRYDNAVGSMLLGASLGARRAAAPLDVAGSLVVHGGSGSGNSGEASGAGTDMAGLAVVGTCTDDQCARPGRPGAGGRDAAEELEEPAPKRHRASAAAHEHAGGGGV